MKIKKAKTILAFLLAISMVLTFASATEESYCQDDVGIRYSYADTYDTGIGISENGTWLNDSLELIKELEHKVKYRIDNNAEFANNATIKLMIDDSIFLEYEKEINTYTSKTADLDLSLISCGLHTITLEVINEGDCYPDNNLALREFYIISENCEEEPAEPVCGNEIIEQGEECDDGNTRNNDGCSSECGIEETQENNGGSIGIGVDIGTEDFAPMVWMCDNRIVYDDATEPGRVSGDGEFLVERINNYAFEGEQIKWGVLVMDKNGKEKIKDVFATVGKTRGEGNDIEVNCQEVSSLKKYPQLKGFDFNSNKIPDSCNARIGEEELHEFDSDTMQYYECTLSVETPEGMYGKNWVTIEALDIDGISGTMDENEYWFFNPLIELGINGELIFEVARPGTDSYSETILVENHADELSGVILDMFISGTDFYDTSSSGAMCPNTNQLKLKNLKYYATNGAYNSAMDVGFDIVDDDRYTDEEGYTNIDYGIGFNNPKKFYDNMEILQAGPKISQYWTANTLSPGSEMALTFKLSLPEPCNGDFNTGQIFFWGEAI